VRITSTLPYRSSSDLLPVLSSPSAWQRRRPRLPPSRPPTTRLLKGFSTSTKCVLDSRGGLGYREGILFVYFIGNGSREFGFSVDYGRWARESFNLPESHHLSCMTTPSCSQRFFTSLSYLHCLVALSYAICRKHPQ